jgi:hypothetical protein
VSKLPRLVVVVPELLESRTQTETWYVPAGLPLVFQANVALAE